MPFDIPRSDLNRNGVFFYSSSQVEVNILESLHCIARSNVVLVVQSIGAVSGRPEAFDISFLGCRVYRNLPNFIQSYYGKTKYLAEQALNDFDVLQLRIMMPTGGTPHPRNLLTKLLSYQETARELNSITVIPDLMKATRAAKSPGGAM